MHWPFFNSFFLELKHIKKRIKLPSSLKEGNVRSIASFYFASSFPLVRHFAATLYNLIIYDIFSSFQIIYTCFHKR